MVARTGDGIQRAADTLQTLRPQNPPQSVAAETGRETHGAGLWRDFSYMGARESSSVYGDSVAFGMTGSADEIQH